MERPTGAAPFAPALRGREAGPDPFLRQRPFILRQGAKHAEQERPLRRGRISLLGQGAKGHALGLEGRDNLEQMRQ